MKLLLENWRQYLTEMISMDDVRRVDKVLSRRENLDTLISLLGQLGWPKEMLETHSKDTPPFSEFRNTQPSFNARIATGFEYKLTFSIPTIYFWHQGKNIIIIFKLLCFWQKETIF